MFTLNNNITTTHCLFCVFLFSTVILEKGNKCFIQRVREAVLFIYLFFNAFSIGAFKRDKRLIKHTEKKYLSNQPVHSATQLFGETFWKIKIIKTFFNQKLLVNTIQHIELNMKFLSRKTKSLVFSCKMDSNKFYLQRQKIIFTGLTVLTQSFKWSLRWIIISANLN